MVVECLASALALKGLHEMKNYLRVTKCVAQKYPDERLASVLSNYLTITYNAIHYAEDKGVANRKGMGGFYRSLKDVKLPSCYKVAAISRACVAVRSRNKAKKRGVAVMHPRPLKPMVSIVSGFFITMKGRLFVPLLNRGEYFDLQLNRHVIQAIEGRTVRSIGITPGSLSICHTEYVQLGEVGRVYGVDRNEKNLTFGDRSEIIQIDMKKLVKIKQSTREIIGSLRRNDVRLRRRLARKYWRRATHRTDQMLHAAANFIVATAFKNGAALALEDLEDIRKMYRKGNEKCRDYTFRLNSWPHGKIGRMLEYKAAWKGITMVPLTKSETYGSSSECASCGEKLHRPAREDAEHGEDAVVSNLQDVDRQGCQRGPEPVREGAAEVRSFPSRATRSLATSWSCGDGERRGR